MRRQTALVVGAIVLAFVVVIGGVITMAINETETPEQATAPLDAASVASAHFLDAYVDPDGRVVRRDQGGDTVSEGQAYAMLAAVATGDQARFDSTWNWAKENLIAENGMMAWNWKDGQVVDANGASDADLDAARALIVASRQFDNPTYADEAKTLATAIMTSAVVDDESGRPILLAGPWATAAPYYTNPSYHSPRTFDELATLTGDNRWNELKVAERARLSQIIQPEGGPVQLPSDWATVDTAGNASVAGAPSDRDADPKYSYDALRTPIRLAESCDVEDQEQARVIWSILSMNQDRRTSPELELDGTLIADYANASAAAATAGGAKAGNDEQQMLDLLSQADRLEEETSTYYGASWAALGRIMLTTNWLGSCS